MSEAAAWSGKRIVQRVVAQILPLLQDGLKGSLATVQEIEAEITRRRRP
jgi:hypothetical protein